MNDKNFQIIPAVALASILILYAGLYATVSAPHAFNQDEGTYVTAALRFAEGDVFLTKAFTDKPPLSYQVFGISAWLFGKTQMAVKLPNALAMMAAILLVYILGRELFNRQAGLLAALLFATSPFLAKTCIGAMTDPLALLFLTASLLHAVRGRILLCGFLFGLSILTRQMALVYLPILIAGFFLSAAVTGAKPMRFARAARLFVYGSLGPAVYLIVWSSFLERDRWRWLVGELLGGKATLGAKRAGLSERFTFWGDTLAGVPFSWIVLLVAAACAILLVAGILLKKTSGDKAETRWLLLLTGAVCYYPLLHTLMGAPLYPRMMAPIAPLLLLLSSALILKAVDWLLPMSHPGIRLVTWFVFSVILIGGTRNLAGIYSTPHPRDDVPEVAEVLKRIAPKGSLVISEDLNRQFMFYLHGSSIGRKQHKASAEKLSQVVAQNPEKELYLAVQAEEFSHLDILASALKPVYRLKQVHTSSHGFLKLYSIVPSGKVRQSGGQLVLTLSRNGVEMEVPVTTTEIEKGLKEFAGNILKGGSVISVRVEPGQSLKDGHLALLELEVEGGVVHGVPVRRLFVRYQNVRVSLVKLLSTSQLVILESDRTQAFITTGAKEISEFLGRKNPAIENLQFRLAKDSVGIGGELKLPGFSPKMDIEGTLSLNEKGRVMFHPTSGKVGGIALPGFVLRMAERSINPAFDTRLSSLKLRGKSVEWDEENLRFVLQ